VRSHHEIREGIRSFKPHVADVLLVMHRIRSQSLTPRTTAPLKKALRNRWNMTNGVGWQAPAPPPTNMVAELANRSNRRQCVNVVLHEAGGCRRKKAVRRADEHHEGFRVGASSNSGDRRTRRTPAVDHGRGMDQGRTGVGPLNASEYQVLQQELCDLPMRQWKQEQHVRERQRVEVPAKKRKSMVLPVRPGAPAKMARSRLNDQHKDRENARAKPKSPNRVLTHEA